jgi:anti-sigma factor RsiW
MNDQWSDRLSDYLDEELAPAERHALESHLGGCPQCQATLAGLRDVIFRAHELPDLEPGRDLWPAIAARLRVTPQERSWWKRVIDRVWHEGRVSLSLPQLAGAASVVAIVTALVMLSRGAGPSSAPVPASVSPGGAVTLANFADPQYDAAVSDLKRALEAGRDRLDPQTVAVLERNLAVIDGAIVQAREALATDPANTYLNSYLAEARRRKLELLRQVTDLADLAS